MAIKSVTTPGNFPFIRYLKVDTRNGRPQDNGSVLTRSVFDQKVTSTVSKDMVARDWRKLIKQGGNATTYLAGTLRHCKKRPGYASVTATRAINDAYGYKPTRTETAYLDLIGTNLPCPGSHNAGSVTADVDSRAKMAFVKRCNEAMQSYKGLQYLAEAAESVRMLRNNTEEFAGRTERYLKSVKDDWLGIRKRKGRKLPNTMGKLTDKLQRALSQRFLEYTYGVKPLIGDTQSAAETLSKIHNYEDSKDFRMVSATAKGDGPVTVTQSGFSLGLFLEGKCSVQTVTHVAVTYRGVVTTELSNLGAVNKFVGLDLTDFLPSLWEWLPWSFVADYVTNISEIVDAVSFARSRLRWTARTQVLETRRWNSDWWLDNLAITRSSPTIYPTIDTWSFSAPDAFWSYKSIDRDTYAGSLIPDFQLSMPKPKQMLNVAVLGLSLKRTRRFISTFLNK